MFVEKNYVDLIKNFRCIICQNQNLYDSNSDFSINIKNVIYDMNLLEYKDVDIINFLICNYGEFISYNPGNNNYMLWFCSVLILIFYILFIIYR